MKTILFQGDSITDAGRSREDDTNRGIGYPMLVSARLAFEYPGQYRLLNRGCSGNRVVDIYARIRSDIINLKPDVMSMLIGVNDVWHELALQNGVDAEKYYRIYAMLIEEVREALPGVRIMILEPFVLKGTATGDCWDIFRSEVEKRAAKARDIAEEYITEDYSSVSEYIMVLKEMNSLSTDDIQAGQNLMITYNDTEFRDK